MAENSQQKVIQRYFSRVEKDLDVRAISGELFSENVIGFDLKQEIDNKETNKAANTVLANYLHQNADMAKLERFLKVLESDKTHPKHMALAKEMRAYLAQSMVSVVSCVAKYLCMYGLAKSVACLVTPVTFCLCM